MPSPKAYRGRLAPSPTGYLHLGHARTFWTAHQRAKGQQGTLVLRSEDLDRSRVRETFVEAMIEDLHWFGLDWQEGPDVGGPFAPYIQSQRLGLHRKTLNQLIGQKYVYPCRCSRRDILAALAAPHADDEDALYPGTCRPKDGFPALPSGDGTNPSEQTKVAWRFQVPEGESVRFLDGHYGEQCFVAGRDFGDFVVWRNDDTPAYQLAVVADDHAMGITEVVRGADLLLSTARQILLYRALGLEPPQFYHCELVADERGERLAKRHDSMSLRSLREQGKTPAELRELIQTE